MGDITEIVQVIDRVFSTRSRMKGGVSGQTIECTNRLTFHEISVWDLDVILEGLQSLAAERDALQAKLDTSRADALKEAIEFVKGLRGAVDGRRTEKAVIYDSACDACIDGLSFLWSAET